MVMATQLEAAYEGPRFVEAFANNLTPYLTILLLMSIAERDELALTDTIGNFVCRSCTNSFRIEFGALTSLKPTTKANDLKNYEKANRLMPSLRYKDPQRYTQEIVSCIRYNGEKDKDGQSDYLKI
ncbi:unnamed protein product, partial [Mesorhabditis spiculigera]